MWKRATIPGKLVIVAVALGLLYLAGSFGYRTFAPKQAATASVVPIQANLPDAQAAEATKVSTPFVAPASDVAPMNGIAEFRSDTWAWNAQMGKMLGNGGPVTTVGSLSEKYGVRVRYTRQDDTNVSAASLVKMASELAKGVAEPTGGIHFISIMGDGGASFIVGLNEALAKVNPSYKAEIIGSSGYSRGEDCLMGQAAWKATPKDALGGVIAGVIRDGDWNIALKWAGDNNLPNNPDEKTYDPGALNWVGADNFLDAAAKYISGYCEDRPVVNAGKPTGKTAHICVNGVVTWTPGDVNVAQKKGGLVKIVSTKNQYRYQMPEVIIGLNAYNQAHADLVARYLASIMDGGAAVRSDPKALRQAAGISAKVYGEQDANYWLKYYRGVTEIDATDVSVDLGGSQANTLADNLHLFGLPPYKVSLFAATYTVFGDIVHQQYPKLVPSYPPASDVFNPRYLLAAQALVQTKGSADVVTFEPGKGITQEVSRRAWTINFDSGKATVQSTSIPTLQDLERQLLVAGSLAVRVEGHTDNVGNAASNVRLSQDRAQAVIAYLQQMSPENFPAARFMPPVGYGDTQPVASNKTSAGKAANRRVVIALGNQ